MSDPDLFPHGYGRAWSEPKSTGIRRLFQMGREPATTKALGWILAVAVAIWSTVAIVAAIFRHVFA